jgi:hypothetical protein
MDESDYRHLIIGDKDIALNTVQLEKLRLTFKKILYEYAELSDNRRLLTKFQKEIQIEKLKMQYSVCTRALEIYSEHNFEYAFKILEVYNYNIDVKKEIEPQIKNVIRKLKALNTKISILEINFKKRFKPNEERTKTNLYKQAIHLELALKLGYSIDIENTTVTKWLALHNIVKEIKK